MHRSGLGLQMAQGGRWVAVVRRGRGHVLPRCPAWLGVDEDRHLLELALGALEHLRKGKGWEGVTEEQVMTEEV